jgi:hypothetical protein
MPVVAHLHDGQAVRGRNADFYTSACTRELERVREKVVDYLAEPGSRCGVMLGGS